MALKLYNTRTRQKEIFKPLDPSNVRMYVCGPTVYDYAHIGNARPVIVFDVLYRLLRHLAAKGEWDGGKGETKVTYARNITDVDDKINARAAEEGVPIRELTERTHKQFHEDVAALGCLPPNVEPRATDHIEEMKAMIKTLVEKGCAYVAEDHVLFHVAAMPDYGKLSRRSLDEMQAGARVEVAPYKRDPMDFVLWKPSKNGEPSWPSPCGIAPPGRPGWHIECSAMAEKHLGKTFDIHGGGIDLVFPHHENEVAQSRCAHDQKIMANVWMHNGFLQVEGQKMSKSLGNFYTIHELLETTKFHGQWSGEELRLAMLMTHYRQPLDFTEEKLSEAASLLRNYQYAIRNSDPRKPKENASILEALGDDLNTPKVRAELDRLSKASRSLDGEEAVQAIDELIWGLNLIGFNDFVARNTRVNFELDNAIASATGFQPNVTPDGIRELINIRKEARKAKNWADADRIRDELAAMGIALKDAKDPETGEIVTTWEIAR